MWWLGIWETHACKVMKTYSCLRRWKLTHVFTGRVWSGRRVSATLEEHRPWGETIVFYLQERPWLFFLCTVGLVGRGSPCFYETRDPCSCQSPCATWIRISNRDPLFRPNRGSLFVGIRTHSSEVSQQQTQDKTGEQSIWTQCNPNLVVDSATCIGSGLSCAHLILSSEPLLLWSMPLITALRMRHVFNISNLMYWWASWRWTINHIATMIYWVRWTWMGLIKAFQARLWQSKCKIAHK